MQERTDSGMPCTCAGPGVTRTGPAVFRLSHLIEKELISMFHKTLLTGALLATALFAGSSMTFAQNSDTASLRRTQIGEVTNIGIDQVTILINGRKPMSLKIDQSTKISIDGKTAALDNVRRGDTVRVVTREKDQSTAEILDVAKDPEEESRVAQGGVPGQPSANRNGNRDADRNERDEQMPAVALGIAMGDEPGDKGVEVEQIHPGSPADRAGVRQGDILVSLDGKAIAHPVDVRQLLHTKRNGDQLQIIVKRNGENKTLSATLVGRESIFGAQGPNQQQFAQQPYGFGFPGANPTYRVERRAWMGLGLEDKKNGVEVDRVYPAGPAARAGFEQDDVITAIDGKKISKSQDVFTALDQAQPGSKAEFTVQRDGKEQKLEVVYGDSNQFQFGNQGYPQNGQAGQQGFAQNGQYGQPGGDQFVPAHDMMLEFHRHMAVQNERLEMLVTELRDEVRELRKEVQQLKSK